MTESGRSTPSAPLYRLVWRWHFFAGLFVAPLVIVLAVSGGLYLFANEIESVWYRDLLRLASAAPADATSPRQQQDAVLNAYPGARIDRYEIPSAPDRAAQWQLTTPAGERLTAFIDPRDASITGTVATDRQLMNVVSRLHGELLLGRFGDALVELAACWTFILLVTGVFLWWPRQHRTVGALVPRVHARGRALWRDLHAVPAAWNAPIIAFLVLSGLPWSGVWGEQLARLGTLTQATAPTPNFRAPPTATSAAPGTRRFAVHDHDAASGDLPWAIRKAGLPEGSAPSTAVGIEFVMAQARARDIDRPGLRVLYPTGAGGVFTLSYVPDRAQGQRTVHIDPGSGAVLEDIGWQQYSALGKAVEFGVETHVGRQFGLANQLVLATSCILLVTTVVFGVVTWWRRRPRGYLAAPVTEGRASRGFIAVVVCLGVVFPLAGASMLVVFAADRIVAALRRQWRSTLMTR